MTGTPDTITQDYIKSTIDYNKETGICFWKERPRDDFQYARDHKAWNKKHAATQITTTNPSTGKVVIHLFSKAYNLDQQLWKMISGEQVATIYHANGCNADNRWSNLTLTPTKATKYVGGELILTRNSQDIYLVASGPIERLTPPVEPHPGVHVFNFFLSRKDARTYLLELCDKLECGWTNLIEEY